VGSCEKFARSSEGVNGETRLSLPYSNGLLSVVRISPDLAPDLREKRKRAIPSDITGCVRAKFFAVEWAEVDFLPKVIRLRAGTTTDDEGREMSIVPQLRVLIDQQYAGRQSGCEHVCFRVNRLGHATEIQGFMKAWYSACCRGGFGKVDPKTDAVTGEVEYAKSRSDRKKAKIKMVYRGMIYHDLGRTGVRDLVRAGVPERIAMRITGHKTRPVFESYNIVSSTDIAEAGEKFTTFHAKKFRGMSHYDSVGKLYK
jgi:hypothetical protein